MLLYFWLLYDTTSYFFVSLKFGACYITRQWEEFKIKTQLYIFIYLFGFFFIIKFVFMTFFYEVSNFRNRILTNQKHELVVSNCQRNCMKKLKYRCLTGSKIYLPASIYMLKVNNKNLRTRCKICSKLTIKTSGRRHWRRYSAFIVNFEHISHLALVFLLFHWN